MICDCTPCECNAKPKGQPKRKPVQAKPQPVVETAPVVPVVKRPSFIEAMKAQAATAPQGIKMRHPQAPAPQKVEHSVVVVNVRPVEQLLEEEAIRNFANAKMLSDEDLQKFRMILTTSLSPAEEMRVWKARRHAVQTNSL